MDNNMDNNMGGLDQWIRIFVGIAAGWEFFLIPGQHWWLIFFSSFFFLTGLIGNCPIYSLFHGSTKPSKSSAEP